MVIVELKKPEETKTPPLKKAREIEVICIKESIIEIINPLFAQDKIIIVERIKINIPERGKILERIGFAIICVLDKSG